MLRRAASGHIPATQLSKFAAASRIAAAVIKGWPEAPSSPLHSDDPLGTGPWGIEPVWLPLLLLKILPRKSRGFPEDWANAAAEQSSVAANVIAPACWNGRCICRIVVHPEIRPDPALKRPGHNCQ